MIFKLFILICKRYQSADLRLQRFQIAFDVLYCGVAVRVNFEYLHIPAPSCVSRFRLFATTYYNDRLLLSSDKLNNDKNHFCVVFITNMTEKNAAVLLAAFSFFVIRSGFRFRQILS